MTHDIDDARPPSAGRLDAENAELRQKVSDLATKLGQSMALTNESITMANGFDADNRRLMALVDAGHTLRESLFAQNAALRTQLASTRGRNEQLKRDVLVMLGQSVQYTTEPLKWREMDHIMNEDDGA